MLCKSENRDPAHCLKEGRKVTRCAQDLSVFLSFFCSSSQQAATEQDWNPCQDLESAIDMFEGV